MIDGMDSGSFWQKINSIAAEIENGTISFGLEIETVFSRVKLYYSVCQDVQITSSFSEEMYVSVEFVFDPSKSNPDGTPAFNWEPAIGFDFDFNGAYNSMYQATGNNAVLTVMLFIILGIGIIALA